MFKIIPALFLLISSTFLYAESNVSTEQEIQIFDDTHGVISEYVYDISNSVDNLLSGEFFKEKNEARKNVNYKDEDSLDAFFQTDKFKSETSQTYLRMRIESNNQSKTSDKNKIKLRAHLPLSKTKHVLKLFLKSKKDNNTTKNDSNTKNAKTIEFNSKYSIGASSFKPYLKARYFIAYDLGNNWSFEPAQTFRYSYNDKFEETTDFYLDKKLSKVQLLRFQVSRHTKQHHSGMDYNFATQMFWKLPKKSAFSVSQNFWGNTKYKYDLNKPTYGGISDYATSFNFRQNVWKKWFFYEISPGVNFHRMYNYKPNYNARFFLDIYFGRTYIR